MAERKDNYRNNVNLNNQNEKEIAGGALRNKSFSLDGYFNFDGNDNISAEDTVLSDAPLTASAWIRLAIGGSGVRNIFWIGDKDVNDQRFSINVDGSDLVNVQTTAGAALSPQAGLYYADQAHATDQDLLLLPIQHDTGNKRRRRHL